MIINSKSDQLSNPDHSWLLGLISLLYNPQSQMKLLWGIEFLLKTYDIEAVIWDGVNQDMA